MIQATVETHLGLLILGLDNPTIKEVFHLLLFPEIAAWIHLLMIPIMTLTRIIFDGYINIGILTRIIFDDYINMRINFKIK